MATEAARLVIRIDTNAQTAAAQMGRLSDSTKAAGQSAKGATGAFKSLQAIGIAAIAAAAARSIARMGGELIMAASNAEETANKFAVTFQGINREADTTARNLASNFGLAQDEAQALLANTGDLLTGFGFTRESALDLSTQVQELAVDLASFTNFSGGAEGASEALTKALLGERESVKSLGIAITEADINQLAEDRGIVGELTRQQKAMLTLEIATRQSQNAIGDFARSQDSFANQTRILNASVRDLRVEFGNALLPAATQVVGIAREIADWFGKLDDATKKNIVTAAAFTAGLAAVTAGAFALTVALGALAANPIVLGIAGVAAAVGGIAVAINRARSADAEDLMGTIADELTRASASGEDMVDAIGRISTETGVSVDAVTALADEHGLISGEMRTQLDILKEQREATGQIALTAREAARENRMIRDLLGTAANSMGDMADIAVNFASQTGVSLDRVIDIAENLDNLTETQRDQLQALKDSTAEQQSIASIELGRVASANSYGLARERAQAASEAEAESSERTAEAQAETTRQLEAQQRINDRYLAARAEVLAILESELTEVEKLTAQIEFLQSTPWAQGLLEQDRQAAVEILRQRIQELIAAEEEAAAAAIEGSEDVVEAKEKSTKAVDAYIDSIERAKAAYQDEVDAAIEAERERQAVREESNEAAMEQVRAKVALEEEALQAYRDVQDKEKRIAIDTADEKARIEEQLQNYNQRIQGASFDLLRTLVDMAVEDDRKAAQIRKAISIAEATINTAEAISEYLSTGNVGLAIAAGILGAIQVATIAATPIPGAQQGGSFVVPPGNNDDGALLRVSSGEQVDVTPSRGGGGGSMPSTIIVRIGTREFKGAVEDVFNREGGQIRNPAAIRSR